MTSRSAVNNGTLLAAVTPTETQHLHPDHLGSPRLITGPGGAYRAYHAYQPLGTEATSATQDSERMKFTGHERDLGNTTSTADDLDYMHARYYNMQIGRFTAFDPIGGNPWAPQSWNRYAYVMGNPLKYIDPAGLLPVGFASAIYAASSQFVFFDEITVSASPSSSGGTRSMDQASFLNFLFGNHAGGGASGRSHHQMRGELGLSVREYASHVSAQGGAGDCQDFTCRILAEVAQDTLTGTTYLEAGVVAVTEVWLFSGAGVFSLAGETTGSFRLFGATHDGLRFWASSRSAGGGVHLLRGGKSAGGLDWHRFKLMGRMVNRPHYHRGPNPSQLSKHRPWQGGR